MKYRVGILLMLVLVAGCNGEYPEKAHGKKKKIAVKEIPLLVQPPFDSLGVLFQRVWVDCDSGKIFYAGNGYGTRVEIPVGIFTDSAGKKTTGKVEISYREFHTGQEIFLSGIPLSYNAAGMLKRFSTGGMFEIRAQQEGKNVFLDSGKVIRVNMASFAGDGRYHAFYLDENQQREWNYVSDLNVTDNPKKRNLLNRARAKVTELNIPLGPEYFAFNYKALLDIYLNDRVKEIEQKRADLTIQNKIKEYGVSWSDIYCYQSIDYMGNRYLASLLIWKKITSDPWPGWAKVAEAKIEHLSGNRYELTLTPPKNPAMAKKFTIEALLPIKSLLASPPAQWRYRYNEALQKALREEMRMNLVADVFNEIEVHDLGIYNVDKLMKNDAYIQVNLKPEFDSTLEVMQDFRIYYISPAYRTCVAYAPAQWSNITLTTDPAASLFAVMPGNRVALVSADELKSLKWNELKQSPGTRISLSFKTYPGIIKTREDIRKVLKLSDLPS